jgi:cytochrome c-type biogenesis protein CcmH/NrfG
MAKISLRSYNREIEQLIENGQLDEAIAHCRHILKTFPKHLETYRLLGKAYLEAKRYKEAVDIFQRVLIAVPDDFVSHVGMSIINDDQNKFDNALWHMERAFEVQPSNAAIQGELMRLFERRDGQAPPKIRLTRGALAHMYVQGELYTQAISEIKAVLAADSQRTDMQVLLAKAYFRNGQKGEAADTCSQLLRQSLYCFDANRIMVDLLPGSQRAESTQVFRHRVSELDPYAAFAQESIFKSDEVPDASINLEHFQYTGQVTDSAPGWQELGISLATDTAAASAPAQQPDWLKAASTPAPSATIEPAPKAAPAAPAEENIPDFLRDAGWGQSSGQFQESASVFDNDTSDAGGAVQADLPDWIKAMAPTSDSTPQEAPSRPAATPSADTPDWLRNLGAEPPVAPSASTPAATPSFSAAADDGPAWLKDLGEPIETPATPQASKDIPDWLKDLGGGQNPTPTAPPSVASQPKPQPPVQNIPPVVPAVQDVKTAPPPAAPTTPAAAGLGDLGTSSKEQDDAMAWLESLASKHGAKPEELVTDPNARTDVAPDWVDKAKAVGDVSTAQPASTSMDETGMWLRNLEEQESKGIADQQPASSGAPDWLSELGPTPTKPAAQEDVPDWMRGVSNQDLFTAAAPEKATPNVPAESTSDWLNEIGSGPAAPEAAPNWLNELGAGPAQPTEQENVPDWLRGGTVAASQPEPEQPAAQDFSFAEGVPSDIPDWLAGLDKEEGSQSVISRSDLPAWLQGDAEPEITQPANPADWHPVAMPQEPPVAEPVSSVQPPMREMDFAFEEKPKPVKKPAAPKPEKKVAAPRAKQIETVSPPRSADSLSAAQAEMGRGNISTALEVYDKLIRKGKFLEEIIRDLRDALYRYPVEVAIWQALGDAYMRGSRLQEALDAYTKAEELLR